VQGHRRCSGLLHPGDSLLILFKRTSPRMERHTNRSHHVVQNWFSLSEDQFLLLPLVLLSMMFLSVNNLVLLCVQIAIFVLPVMVLVGWAIGRPFLLDIEPFAALVLTLSVIHTYFVSSDGNSNW
jgi:type IV secretory pathway TrbL component